MTGRSFPPRRGFLAAALAVPAGGLGSSQTPERAGPMPTRVLGKTGLKVSVVGMGCAWTSDPSVVARALDLGINHLDTAPVYQGGNNEPLVRAGMGKRRRQVILTTKTEAGSKNEALQQLEKSLRELGTDYVDVWYLHGKDAPGEIREDLLEAQQTARQQGKIRATGVSTHRLVQTAPAILKIGKIDVVMAAYNFTMGAAAEKAVASLAQAGVGLVTMKAMGGGPRNAVWPGQEFLPGVLKRPGVQGPALRWVLRNRGFASAMVGMGSMEEVEENVRSAGLPLTDADRKVLTARLPVISPFYCRMCGACDGRCPRGLPVADLLRYAMYADSYGQFAFARDQFRRLPEPVQLVRCAECTACPVRCPNGVRVKQRLTQAQAWLA